MSTPRTDKQATGIIGFYSCATVPADFARQLENENRGMMVALKEARTQLAKAAIKLEQYEQGPIRDAMIQAHRVIEAVEKAERGQS